VIRSTFLLLGCGADGGGQSRPIRARLRRTIQGDAEDAAATMTIAVSVTTEAATEPTERRDNEDDDEDTPLNRDDQEYRVIMATKLDRIASTAETG
jgi:hypothetical protein